MIMMRKSIFRVIKLIVIFGIAVQIYILADSYIASGKWGVRVWNYRSRAAWERSALFASYVSDKDFEFLKFLHEATDRDANLFFFEPHGLFSWKPLLQYLLFPRNITTCLDIVVEVCIEGHEAESMILVGTNGLLSSEDIFADYSYHPYSGSKGYGIFVIQEQR